MQKTVKIIFSVVDIGMDNNLDIVVKNKNNCIINGLLTREYVIKLLKLGEEFINNAENPHFSFSGVTKCDSSGIALLIYWWRCAKLQSKEITFEEMTSEMLDIMQLSELDRLLVTNK